MSFEDRLEGKLDKLIETVHEGLVSQAEISTKLNDHIKKQEEEAKEVDKIQKDLGPIKDHISNVRFVSKFVLAPIVATILIGLTKILFF